MQEFRLTVRPFRMGAEKEAALKPLEEAAETYSAWQNWKPYDKEPKCSADIGGMSAFAWVKYKEIRHKILADEIADVIQAACNLAARYGIDLDAAMERCYERNRARGRYAEVEPEPIQMSESAKRVFDRLMRESMGDE